MPLFSSGGLNFRPAGRNPALCACSQLDNGYVRISQQWRRHREGAAKAGEDGRVRERKDEGSESTRGGVGGRKRGRGKDLEEEEKREMEGGVCVVRR